MDSAVVYVHCPPSAHISVDSGAGSRPPPISAQGDALVHTRATTARLDFPEAPPVEPGPLLGTVYLRYSIRRICIFFFFLNTSLYYE